MYHIIIDNKKYGPLSLNELIEKELVESDLIWKIGTENWGKASDLEELKEYFITKKLEVPPLTPKEHKILNGKKRIKLIAIISIIIYVPILLALLWKNGYFLDYEEYLKSRDFTMNDVDISEIKSSILNTSLIPTIIISIVLSTIGSIITKKDELKFESVIFNTFLVIVVVAVVFYLIIIG